MPMASQEQINYERIAEAIEFIRQDFRNQPGLEEIAQQVHMSPFHFQRLFTDWAGVSPKKFLQYTSIEYAKKILQNPSLSLQDVADELGLSGTSRLHDLFITIEGMTPGEYKNGGENLDIHYSFAESPFGRLLVASTHKGICYMAFSDGSDASLNDLTSRFPNARYSQVVDMIQQQALYIFRHNWEELPRIKLHLKGTDFQLKVWETLLRIPMGSLATYGQVAAGIDQPAASRAVGTAIGANPVAYLIPCHRVIRSSGEIGDYMWGSTRKTAIIGWEAARRTG